MTPGRRAWLPLDPSAGSGLSGSGTALSGHGTRQRAKQPVLSMIIGLFTHLPAETVSSPIAYGFLNSKQASVLFGVGHSIMQLSGASFLPHEANSKKEDGWMKNVMCGTFLVAAMFICGCGIVAETAGGQDLGLPDLLLVACADGRAERLRGSVVMADDYVPADDDLAEPHVARAARWQRANWTRLEENLLRIRQVASQAGIDWSEVRLVRTRVYRAGDSFELEEQPYTEEMFVGPRNEIVAVDLERDGSAGGSSGVVYVDDGFWGGMRRAEDYWVVLALSARERDFMVFWLVRRTPDGPRALGLAFAVVMSEEDFRVVAAQFLMPVDRRFFAETLVRVGIPIQFIEASHCSCIRYPKESREPLSIQLPRRLQEGQVDRIWLMDSLSVSGCTELTETGEATRM